MILVVNLMGAPGAGKSTGAAYIFSQLKLHGVNAELVTEYAKDKVWEENNAALNNQAYIFGTQYFRITRCQSKVDVVITDSPLILSAFYNKNSLLGDAFNQVVSDVFKSYSSLNYLITRNKPYQPAGRIHTEEESDLLVSPLKDMLAKHDIEYQIRCGNIAGYDEIVADVLHELSE